MSDTSAADRFVREETERTTLGLVPEIDLNLACEPIGIFEGAEKLGAERPYWAFAWSGGQALARWLLDNPDQVEVTEEKDGDPRVIPLYVAEPDLGKLRTGMTASVAVDSFPDRRFEGWVGFISPVAEFTPKTVQTEELRTSLVYEVRVFVKDPSDQLHLGSPTTVHLPPNDTPPASGPAPNARVQQ